MTYFSATILGLVQGLTEFLPVSSTGHLIVARYILDLPIRGSLAFDVFLHLATALAIIIYFRHELWRLIKTLFVFVSRRPVTTEDKTLLIAIVVGTIPAAVLGYFFESVVDSVFRSRDLVAYALILGSILFWVAEERGRQTEGLTIKKGWWLGFYQTLALIPGASRSGMTISGGLLLGLKREMAARFSFLLALPIILGAGLKTMLDIGVAGVKTGFGGPLLFGSLVAFIVGLVTVHFLIKYLRTNSLKPFIVYRILLAFILLIF